MKFISKGKAARFIIILNRKVGQNHQVGAMKVKPKWKQKFLGMASQSEMACGQWHLHVSNLLRETQDQTWVSYFQTGNQKFANQ